MAEYRGMEYLRRKLWALRSRVLLRYKYYEMKDRNTDRVGVIPPNLRQQYSSTLGWCAKSVDSLADRLQFRGFKNDNFNLEEIFRMNNFDVFFDSAILGALISSCDFVSIAPDEDKYPRLEVVHGGNATGIIDERTGMLKEGYAVLERKDGNPYREAYYLPHVTEYYVDGKIDNKVEHDAPYPLLVPIIYRPDAMRPFGHSRISRTCMYLQKDAKRTLERADVSAEFYSFPQKYILGLSNEAERMDKWAATISSFLDFRQDEENGNTPSVGQFQQQSMTPYTDQLRTLAAMFAGETGLTLDDLGFVSQNPSSSEAIKASHETLRATARRAQKTFGSGFLNVGYLASCIRDKYEYQRDAFYMTTPLWEPVFEPDFAAMGAIGDGIQKVNTAIPGYFNSENMRDLIGIEGGNTQEPISNDDFDLELENEPTE